MKNISIFILVVGIFLTLNFTDLRDFYYTFLGNIKYQQEDFTLARKYYRDSENIGKSFYKEQNYKEAIKSFEVSSASYQNLYNLGNAYFKLGEIEESKVNWEKSVEFYRRSLEKRYDEKTEKNLDFVLGKLTDLKEKESSNIGETEQIEQSNKSKLEESESFNDKQTDSRGKEKNGGEEKNPSEERRGTGKEEQSSLISSGQDEKQKKNEKLKRLSSEEKTAFKSYTKELQESEKEYGQYFGKIYKQENTSEFDAFFNDPFFDNSLLEKQTDDVKDW